jgi:hypothetical protein
VLAKEMGEVYQAERFLKSDTQMYRIPVRSWCARDTVSHRRARMI